MICNPLNRAMHLINSIYVNLIIYDPFEVQRLGTGTV